MIGLVRGVLPGVLFRVWPIQRVAFYEKKGHRVGCPFNSLISATSGDVYWNVMKSGDGLSFTTSSRVSIGLSFL